MSPRDPITLALLIPIVAIICGTILSAIKIFRGETTEKGRRSHADEARRVQEIYQGITRMEQRIESLETIILERERKR